MLKSCKRKNENKKEKREELTCLPRHFSRGSSVLSVVGITHPGKKATIGDRRKSLISAFSLQIIIHHCGEVKAGVWRSCSHHMHSGEYREMHACLFTCLLVLSSNFSTPIQFRAPYLANGATGCDVDLQVSFNSIKTMLHRYALSPNRYRQPLVDTLPGDPRLHQVDN